MLRFVALNDEANDGEPEDEVAVTKEAQETIAESEYVRAMKLKYQGKPHLALSLLAELLQTKVLNEIVTDDKNDKLWSIRYNCHKNMAIIYEEKEDFEMALENYIVAMQIDDSDVYSMHRFGQLALKTNALELAEFAFDNCLRRNPLHWNAADGMLQTLCQRHNILGAYGWALKLYRRDPDNERAQQTLREVASTFRNSIPFYEKIWGAFPEELKVAPVEPLKNVESVFPHPANSDEADQQQNSKIQPPNLSQFCVQELSFFTLGKYICDVYEHLQKTEQSMLFAFRFDDILYKKTVSSEAPTQQQLVDVKDMPPLLVQDINSASTTPRADNSNNNSSSCEDTADINQPPQTQPADVNCDPEPTSQSSELSTFVPPALTTVAAVVGLTSAETQIGTAAAAPVTSVLDVNVNEDSDSNAKSDGNDAGSRNKPKPRRRCSDLHFLEQWGWHKNRRRKKTVQPDRTEVDTSLNGYLRKIFSKFTNASFKETWPFKSNNAECLKDDLDVGSSKCTDCLNNITVEDFQRDTQAEFDVFIAKLKAKPFDIMLLIYKWLKHLSIFWNKRFPEELKELFLNIFHLYLKHFDFSTWNQLSNKNIEASCRICALFLELDYVKTFNKKVELSHVWMCTFNQLMFNTGCAMITLGDRFETHKLRLINLEYLCWRYSNQLEKCVACLEHMAQMIGEHDATFVLHLPNLKDACIRKAFVTNTRIELKRQISLNKVPALFEAENWSQLTDIIRDNILNTKNLHDSENWVQDFKIQIEMLLQSLWNLNAFDECLSWAEKFIHYVTNQYLKETAATNNLWSESINFIFSYIEALILNEGFEILAHLDAHDLLARLVQNTMRLLSFQLDGAFDRNTNAVHQLETKRPWVVLHQIMLREENNTPVIVKTKSVESEDDDELIPNSFLVLFTAHEFLGKRQYCTRDNGGFLHYTLDAVAPNLRAPLYDTCRDAVFEYIEQVTYCLYGYPQKKARSRHLEDHEAQSVELTWAKSIQLFDLYRPECLPEFNSYKLESISADMEQLLLKILVLMPKEYDPTPASTQILQFINGEKETLPDEMSPCFSLPYKIRSIFYLLADYYFKNRDFSKTIKYYMLDLAGNATRFDSWAGMALSKASKIETKLNGLAPINLMNLLVECEDTIRCFERCIYLDRNQTLLWIEYGSFTYTIHSYCSRHLKQFAEKLTAAQCSLVAERKDKLLQIAYNCFSLAAKLLNNTTIDNSEDNDDESHEEKWLCQYMLGKVAEKRKEQPKIYLDYYLMAANYLYESSATYPIKINHSNPTTLSVEALEVFYRINSAIIKYLENEKEVNRENGDLFNNVLKNLADSPFAYNKAKVDGNSINALKRKIADKMEQATAAKLQKTLTSTDVNPSVPSTTPTISVETPREESNKVPPAEALNNDVKIGEENNGNTNGAAEADALGKSVVALEQETKVVAKEVGNSTSPSRRESQESAATGSSATTITSSTTTSSTNSSDSSTSDSDSDSDATSSNANSELKKSRANNLPYTASELETIYKIVIQNLEECVTRFPEHYKSIFRLVYHYMNGPTNLCDLSRCEQLLLGQYRTTLGNQINGVFYDRKNNNLFNGIWRIPSSEIDRPGSFSAHLVKCVGMLIHLLMKSKNHKLLIDIGLTLFKTPDYDKRYIKDTERIELYQQSITYCAQILRNIFKENIEKRNDTEILNLLIDIYKIHKKCIKYMNQKELLFVQLLIDVYKFYVQDKVDYLPENLNFFDLSIKLCLQEIGYRKNIEKLNSSGPTRTFNLGDALIGLDTSAQTTPTRTIQIPGLPMRNRARPTVNAAAHNNMGLAPMNLNFAYTSGMASSLTTTMPITTQPTTATTLPTNLLNPANFMSMINFLGSQSSLQKDNLDYQRLIAQYYKHILEGMQKEQNPAAASVNQAPNPPTATTPTLPTTAAVLAASTPTIPPPQLPQIPLLSLASSLPYETTLTPSTPQSRMWQAEMQNRISLSSATHETSATVTLPSVSITSTACADLTITRTEAPPARTRAPTPKLQPTPAISIELQPVSMSQTTLNALNQQTVAAGNTNRSADIFVRPLSSMQQAGQTSTTQLMDLPKELTIQALAGPLPKLPEPLSSSSSAATNKFQAKAKTASRSKPAASAAKPYTRLLELPPKSVSPMSYSAANALLEQIKNDPYYGQTQQLMDMLKNRIALQQFQLPGAKKQQKPAARRPAAKRKPKPTPPQVAPATLNSDLLLPSSSAASVSAASFSSSVAKAATTTMSLPTVQSTTVSAAIAAFGFPAFDGQNVITMTPLPMSTTTTSTSAAASARSNTPNAAAAFPLGPIPGSSCFSPAASPSSYAAAISPTKTLQQKLAERQKANQQQQNELKKSNSPATIAGTSTGGSSNSEKKPHVDVIILD